MHGHLSRIKDDLDVLLNICSQANGQKKMVLEKHLDEYHNMEFGSVLADAFITRYRSSYDTIAWAFKEIARHPGNVSPKFAELRKVSDEDEYVRNLGDKLANLIQSVDWFDQIKDLRDRIIHYNFKTGGFMAPIILFQVTEGFFENKINFPGAMINENLVDFELYAGVHVAYSLWLLEEFAKIGYNTLKPERFPEVEPKKGHDGFEALNEWIERVLASPPPQQ